MLLTRSKEADYAELCQLDVLGLGEQKSNKKGKIYQELKDQLWWDGTKQVFFGKQIELPTNKAGSLARLMAFLSKLKKNLMLFD